MRNDPVFMGKLQLLIGLFGIVAYWSCYDPSGDNSRQSAAILAQIHCGSCHLMPKPSELPRAVWQEHILPRMGYFLGFRSDAYDPAREIPMADYHSIKSTGLFPDQPLLTEANWQQIKDFYISNAPDTLPTPPAGEPPAEELKLFEAIPAQIGSTRRPLTTLVDYQDSIQTLYIGNGQNLLFRITGQHRDSIILESYPVHVTPLANGSLQVLCIGDIFPNDQRAGQLFSIDAEGRVDTILQGLRRPVHALRGDLNQDGQEDILVANFGHYLGSLEWYENRQAGFKARTLWEIPGGTQNYIKDLNGDGLPDILSLFGQGNEGVFAFYNEGNGEFRRQALLQFSPIFGTSSFELNDFDQDGRDDILLTNGDNADYSFVLKPYHGLRIFRQDHSDRYRETFFYPMHGASKALARDFDEDGDLDIVAIAFFPDFESEPAKSFVYLENISAGASSYSFKPYLIPTAIEGRWLVMDAGDVDQDGDIDIVLGSFSYSPTRVPPALQQRWIQNGPDLLILKNKLHRRNSYDTGSGNSKKIPIGLDGER